MKIGFSLSFCVADICRGAVKLEDVSLIVASTYYPYDEDWNKALDYLCKEYWSAFPEYARLVVYYLRNKNKISQPRLKGEPWEAPYIGDGKHWIERDENDKWTPWDSNAAVTSANC